MPARAGLAQVNGAALHHEVAGTGRAILLLHAGVADSRMWNGTFEAFAGRFQTIRFDIRRFGRSPMPSGRFSYHGDVAGLLDSLGVASASLVGCSFGGQIAIDFCLAYPSRVESLVLVASSIGGREPSEERLRFEEEEEALLANGEVEAATELNVRTWVDGPHRSPDAVDPTVRERVRVMQREAFQIPMPEGIERERLEPAAIARLREISVPTLVLVGDQDHTDQIEAAGRLAAEIPGARQILIPGAAHMLSMEQPKRFNEIVMEFLGAEKAPATGGGSINPRGGGESGPSFRSPS